MDCVGIVMGKDFCVTSREKVGTEALAKLRRAEKHYHGQFGGHKYRGKRERIGRLEYINVLERLLKSAFAQELLTKKKHRLGNGGIDGTAWDYKWTLTPALDLLHSRFTWLSTHSTWKHQVPALKPWAVKPLVAPAPAPALAPALAPAPAPAPPPPMPATATPVPLV